MPSSVVAAIKYDFENKTLRVIYQSGSVYDYREVSPEVYEGMKAARSKGTYLNRYVLDKYDFDRVK